MEKETKNILTRESLAKELRSDNTVKIRHSLVLLSVFSVICLPLAFGFVYMILSSYKNIVFAILLSIFIGGWSLYPFLLGLFGLFRGFWERSLLEKGAFEVTVRSVSEKTEKRRPPYYRYRLVEVLCFSGFKPIQVKHTVYQLASLQDKYYLVHYQGKNKIKLLYPLKTHEYIA